MSITGGVIRAYPTWICAESFDGSDDSNVTQIGENSRIWSFHNVFIGPSPFAVYVHIPFCPTKCGYCDFNSYAMTGPIVERTVKAITTEIERSPWAGRPAKTIFFGGGTPTMLAAEQLLRIFDAVLRTHPPVEGAEITSEANPGTVDSEKFGAMRAAGFNRISLGAQSFQDSDLITLGRIHRSGEIERAGLAARSAGFSNINVDLMFALPLQSRVGWNSNLDRAFALSPDHISLYCLTIEQNTAFFKQVQRGELALPDEDAQIQMYDDCVGRTVSASYAQYEISNFAHPGRECQHNLCYWRGEEYAGYGPGAVGFVDGRRYTNLKHPDGYSSAVEGETKLAFEEEFVDAKMHRTEKIMLGLRLNEGIDATSTQIEPAAINRVVERGWVEAGDGRIWLTPAGRHVHNEVVVALL